MEGRKANVRGVNVVIGDSLASINRGLATITINRSLRKPVHIWNDYLHPWNSSATGMEASGDFFLAAHRRYLDRVCRRVWRHTPPNLATCVFGEFNHYGKYFESDKFVYYTTNDFPLAHDRRSTGLRQRTRYGKV